MLLICCYYVIIVPSSYLHLHLNSPSPSPSPSHTCQAKFTYDLGSFLSSWIFISAPVQSSGALPYLAMDPILIRRAGFCAALFMLTLLSNVLESPLQMLRAVRRRIGALIRLGRRKRRAACEVAWAREARRLEESVRQSAKVNTAPR